jgi:hypothetical protein
MRKFLLALLCLIPLAASAGNKINLYEPRSPMIGMFPGDFAPYTFVTGFSPDGHTIEGVCGYYNRFQRAWYTCTWPLSITVIPNGYSTVVGPPVLGDQLCCSVYGQFAPKPVYGPFTNYAGYTIATPLSGGPPYLVTP